jgi:pilus assembly protein Flp/PilA
MITFQAALYSFLRQALVCEQGQDIVEYSLVLAMVAFGAVTGMGYLATGITDVFSTVSTTLTTSV